MIFPHSSKSIPTTCMKFAPGSILNCFSSNNLNEVYITTLSKNTFIDLKIVQLTQKLMVWEDMNFTLRRILPTFSFISMASLNSWTSTLTRNNGQATKCPLWSKSHKNLFASLYLLFPLTL
jgi:hypothetical protein